MSKIELPPVPAPVSVALIAGPQGSEYRHLAETWEPDTARHSESQLHARDRQIVEVCAAICDEINTESGGGFEGFAEALRALLGGQHG